MDKKWGCFRKHFTLLYHSWVAQNSIYINLSFFLNCFRKHTMCSEIIHCAIVKNVAILKYKIIIKVEVKCFIKNITTF